MAFKLDIFQNCERFCMHKKFNWEPCTWRRLVRRKNFEFVHSVGILILQNVQLLYAPCYSNSICSNTMGLTSSIRWSIKSFVLIKNHDNNKHLFLFWQISNSRKKIKKFLHHWHISTIKLQFIQHHLLHSCKGLSEKVITDRGQFKSLSFLSELNQSEVQLLQTLTVENSLTNVSLSTLSWKNFASSSSFCTVWQISVISARALHQDFTVS